MNAQREEGVVTLALPSKGQLEEGTLQFLASCGLRVDKANPRQYQAEMPALPQVQVLFQRAEDVVTQVAVGTADLGITGLDLVRETNRRVETLMELDFGRCRLVVAVPEDSPVQDVSQVRDGCTVATCFPNLTKAFFEGVGKRIELAEVSGATEVAPQIGLADVITDLTETGSTLKLNHLREIGVILESVAVLIANGRSVAEKKTRIEEVTSAIRSVMSASKKRYLMANVPKASLQNLKTLIPGVSGPTVMNIMGRDDMVAIHVVVNEDEVNGVITMLKSIGGTGILVVPIDRMVL